MSVTLNCQLLRSPGIMPIVGAGYRDEYSTKYRRILVMLNNTGGKLFAIITAIVGFTTIASAEERTWSDKSGKFSVMAEFVRIDGDRAVLRRSDGKEIKVPIEKLSEDDQAVIKAQSTDAAPASDAVNEILAKI